jgi:hypothetical protein
MFQSRPKGKKRRTWWRRVEVQGTQRVLTLHYEVRVNGVAVDPFITSFRKVEL